MNRCITCGKIVTRLKAQKIIEHDGRSYLVCCPICEKEFMQNSDHYIAIARSIFEENAVKAHPQYATNSEITGELSRNHVDIVHVLGNLKESFEALKISNKEILKHFDKISASGGLEGLRNSLREHRQMLSLLQEDMVVHAGVCRFVLSVADSTTKSHLYE